MQPDRLLRLSFSVLCLAVCFDIISKLSPSSVLILKVPPTKMFPFSQPAEKPADKNSRGWPLGGCCLYYTTIFISSRDVTLLLRKSEVFCGQSVCPSRPTGQEFLSYPLQIDLHLTFRIDEISKCHHLICNTAKKYNESLFLSLL